MSRHGRVYRLDELTEYDRVELREDGLSFFGQVVECAPDAIYVRWETPGDGPDLVGLPHKTLVRKA